ncbi:hypothetical protein CN384_06150 [Bacillus thuringiensis]|uniref:hypothetical protein n=1 Tax=Bacillus cereus group TaxID=86661 RepID=UPI000BFA11B1|nr:MULTISPECIES: hypothetical protein [Bacillus cereus group]PEZ75130.1 hypothetical protein CN410_13490 [Bacillus anthracis]PFA29321.1 hypothetical protein CN384_06150 [Bacillus thuringiensis]PGW06672.1 hypothetical protein COD97_26995 [Bacillus cereus]
MNNIKIPYFVAIEIQEAKQHVISTVEVLKRIYNTSQDNEELKAWLKIEGNSVKLFVAVEEDYDVEYMDIFGAMEKLEAGYICCCIQEGMNTYYRFNSASAVYEQWFNENNKHVDGWIMIDSNSLKKLKTDWYVVPSQCAEKLFINLK